MVWGRRGVSPGDFVRPRAAAITPDQHLYIVDFTARIQAYDLDGHFLNIGWQTPEFFNGKPSGLSIGRDGSIIVSDSHYHCVRIYTLDGKQKKVLGGVTGSEPGQFGYVSDAVEDTDGNFFLSEFGANERITKLAPDGSLIKTIGGPGPEPGQFNHLRGLAIGPDQYLYVADACNHRVQVLALNGDVVRIIGGHGTEPGQFAYPYDVAFGPRGDLYVVEFGNHRVQKLNTKGESIAIWGSSGRLPGQLYSPWALAVDSKDRVHVIDTENHRVQRIRV
ncbi:MAG: NHL repeat-containing protein [Gemmataceae bacterium]